MPFPSNSPFSCSGFSTHGMAGCLGRPHIMPSPMPCLGCWKMTTDRGLASLFFGRFFRWIRKPTQKRVYHVGRKGGESADPDPETPFDIGGPARDAFRRPDTPDAWRGPGKVGGGEHRRCCAPASMKRTTTGQRVLLGRTVPWAP